MPNSDHIAIIAAAHYGQTVEALKQDPILIKMATAIPQSTDISTHDFMMKALRTYSERGGQIETHIGGPAEAIRQIVAETKRYSWTIDGVERTVRLTSPALAESARVHDAVATNQISNAEFDARVGPLKEID